MLRRKISEGPFSRCFSAGIVATRRDYEAARRALARHITGRRPPAVVGPA